MGSKTASKLRLKLESANEFLAEELHILPFIFYKYTLSSNEYIDN